MSRQSFVNMALSYLGVKEGSARHKYIIDTYNDIVPLPQGYCVTTKDAWCAAFVSAMASLCGILHLIPAECSCPRQIKLWKKMGRWVDKEAYVPKTGDVVYYDFNNDGISDHVGIVVSVSNGKMKVVEGNYSDSVGYRVIEVNSKSVIGFGCPKFPTNNNSSKEMCQVELRVLKSGSKGSAVRALQILLIGNNYSCGKSGVDGDFGNDTLKAVKKYQQNNGLEPDGVVGRLTWASILL